MKTLDGLGLRAVFEPPQGGNVRCALKTPYRNGTTHVIFEPEEFMAHIPVHHPFGAVFGRANRRRLPLDHCTG